MNIANEFYTLNDIEINSKKSELLVINTDKKKRVNQEHYIIEIGKKGDKVLAKKDTSAYRHLGVWITGQNNQKCSLNIIRNEVSRMCKAIKWKRASASQLIYLNNSVLLPSIEYRLQTTFLTKSTCDKIQRPMWILIKNKLELASTTASSICNHIGFLGLRSIWQNQITHQFTELTICLNKKGILGITTRQRLKEGQIQSKSLKRLTSREHKFNKSIPKHNLPFKVLHESAKLGLRINKLTDDTDELDKTGAEIYSLLEKKEAYSFASTDRMNLFVLEQLIDSLRKFMLTWQQTKYIKSLKKKGRTPSWYLKLEQKVLKEGRSREVKDAYRIKKINEKAIKIRPKRIA